MIFIDSLIPTIRFHYRIGVDMHLAFFKDPEVMLTAFVYLDTNNLPILTYY